MCDVFVGAESGAMQDEDQEAPEHFGAAPQAVQDTGGRWEVHQARVSGGFPDGAPAVQHCRRRRRPR